MADQMTPAELRREANRLRLVADLNGARGWENNAESCRRGADALDRLAGILDRDEEVAEDEGWHIGGAWGDYGEVVVPLRILSYVIGGELDQQVVSTDPGYALTYAEQVRRAEQAEQRLADVIEYAESDSHLLGMSDGYAEALRDVLRLARGESDVIEKEAIDRMGPAAGCAYCVGAGGYEDYDGEWRECSCQRADREPSDAYVKSLTREFERIWDERVDDFDPEVHDEYPFIEGIMRAALLAAQEVRRADNS